MLRWWRVPRAGQLHSLRRIPLRMLAPSLVTLLALCAGLTAIRMVFEQRWEWAVFSIFFAAVLDMLDGRLARFLHATSRFGAELDSLADFVNFGVAPAVLLYSWHLREAGSLGWLVVLIFAIGTALRLARFNTLLDAPNKPHWQLDFFIGVPAPAAALVVLLPVYLELLGLIPHWHGFVPMIMLYTAGIAFLMISHVPSFSGKRFGSRIPREQLLLIFVLIILLVGLFVSYPFVMLSLASLFYLMTLPFSWRLWQKQKRKFSAPPSSGEGNPAP